MRDRFSRIRLGLSALIVVGLAVVGLPAMFGGQPAEAVGRGRLHVEGTVLAPTELGDLTVRVWEYTGVEPCDFTTLPADVAGTDLVEDASWVLAPGGEQFDYRLSLDGPFTLTVESEFGGVLQHWSPLSVGDDWTVGCFDDESSYAPDHIDIGTVLLNAGLSGTVVDGQNAPVEGARVRSYRLHPVDSDDEYVPYVPGTPEWASWTSPVEGDWVVTDLQGEFELPGARPGWYAVEVDAPGYVRFYLPDGGVALDDADLFELAGPGLVNVGSVDVTVGDEWPESSDNTGRWYDVVPNFFYQYEATPEDDPELWESFESFVEMLEVSQIDPLDLPLLSTPELLEAVLCYTFFGNVTAYNTPQEGMNAVIEQFDGLEELLSRPDVGQVVLDFYSQVDLNDVLETDQVGLLRFPFFELIIAQYQVLSSLGAGGRAMLMDAVAQKAEAKLAIPEQPFSGGSSGETLIAVKIIQLDHPDLLAGVGDVEEIIKSGQVFGSPEWLASPMAEYAERESTHTVPTRAPFPSVRLHQPADRYSENPKGK